MGILNELGYVDTTFSDKVLALQEIFKTAFGANIDLSATSPQGILINYLATIFDNEDKLGLNFFQSMDYHNASGSVLSLIAISKGQPRLDGTVAALTATFTSSATGYLIPAGSLFGLTGDNTKQFKTLADVTISSTSEVVSLEGVNKESTGAIVTDNLTAIGNLPLLTDIEILTITDGTDIESDEALITRLDNSDTETGINDQGAVADKIRILDNVQRVRVFNNDSSVTVDSIPAYSIEAQVVGGDDTEIAQAILDNRATGTPTSGSETVEVIDSEGYPKDISFNRPDLVPIYVDLTLTARNGQTIDTSMIETLKNRTQNYINSLLIGDDVSYTQIYGIWGTQNFNIALEISDDDITYVTTDLTIANREYAYMADTDQIEVTI